MNSGPLSTRMARGGAPRMVAIRVPGGLVRALPPLSYWLYTERVPVLYVQIRTMRPLWSHQAMVSGWCTVTRRAVAVVAQLSPAPLSNTQSPEKREDLQFRLLRLLEAHPDYSQRAIANELGISLGGVNYCLKAVIGKGLVKVENFTASRHKLGYLHVLTPSGIAARAALTQRFLERKLVEYQAISAEIAALQREAGRTTSEAGTAALRGVLPGSGSEVGTVTGKG